MVFVVVFSVTLNYSINNNNNTWFYLDEDQISELVIFSEGAVDIMITTLYCVENGYQLC